MVEGIAGSLILSHLLLSLLMFPVDAIPQLTQVHVITRHGSRTGLQKTATSRQEFGEALLTPLGEKQLYDLGLWLRRRYGPYGLALINDYKPDDIRIESSDLERTISSANALSLGLYPPSTRVSTTTTTSSTSSSTRTRTSLLPNGLYPSIPVYMSERPNDIYIRAYEKCPTFNERLKKLYKSSNWTSVQNENIDFLTSLAHKPGFTAYKNNQGFVPIEEVWNIYDVLMVDQVECGADPTSQYCLNETMTLSDSDFAKLRDIAHYAELTRYDRDTAGDLLGGNLLFKMYERMAGIQKGVISVHENIMMGRKYYHYSGHYPTLLSLFSALDIPAPVSDVIPGYGAVVIFELYEDAATNDKTVSLLYKGAQMSTEMSVPFNGACYGQDNCALSNLKAILDTLSYSSPSEWCTACGNELADVCLSAKLKGNQAPTMAPPPVITSAPVTTDPPTSSPQWEPVMPGNSNTDASNTVVPGVCNVSAPEITAVFLGGVGVGVLLLLIIRMISACRHGAEDGIEESSNDPDKIIDLDFSDRHA